MNILTFDTCFGACSVAAGLRMGTAEAVVNARFERMEMGHVEHLLPMIAEVIAEAGVPLSAFDLIGVTHGPGSFAGTRIGIAAGKGLAFASGVPLTGISSLAVMAAQAGRNDCSPWPLCVAVDVRRGELYTQTFNSTGTKALSLPALTTLEEALNLGRNAGITYVGSGANLIGMQPWNAKGEEPKFMFQPDVPDARYALDLLFHGGGSHVFHTDRPITPHYLRPPDAKPPALNPLQRH